MPLPKLTLSLLSAVLGVVLIVAGVSVTYWPAGLLVAGVALVMAAYVARYLEVQSEDS